MPVILNLYIPGKVIPKISVLPEQKISVINNIKIFSSKNKMLFISKGMILSYNKTIKYYNLSNGDSIFALIINENDSFLNEYFEANDDICISQIKNKIKLFGPCYEANLTSINKILLESTNLSKEKVLIHDQLSFREVARIQDIKSIRRENCKKAWKKQLNSYFNKESSKFICCELSNINYKSPKEPCCDALPIIL